MRHKRALPRQSNLSLHRFPQHPAKRGHNRRQRLHRRRLVHGYAQRIRPHHPKVHLRPRAPSDYSSLLLTHRHRQRIEKRPVPHHKPRRSQTRRQPRRPRKHRIRNMRQPLRPMVNRVHRSHHRQQHLRRADVRSRFLPPNMLLPRLQRQPQRRVPARVNRNPHQPSWDIPLVSVLHCHISRMRPAVSHRHAEPLR